jgi:hypothetical protein
MMIKKNGNVPSKRELLDDTPLSYDVEPYPLDDEGEISWLVLCARLCSLWQSVFVKSTELVPQGPSTYQQTV